jgi:hypothetical protein
MLRTILITALCCSLSLPAHSQRPVLDRTIDDVLTEYNSYRLGTALDLLLDDYFRARATPMLTRRATVCIVVDDQSKEWSQGTVGSPAVSIRTICRQNGIRLGFSLSASLPLFGQRDTTSVASGTLSVWNLAGLIRDGHEIGSGGRTEPGTWFHGDTGKLATGAYTIAELDATMEDHFAGQLRCMQDTLGPIMGVQLPPASWHSSSNSSEAYITSKYAAAAGFDYVVVFPNTMSVGSGQGSRPNELYPLNSARWGMWGTGGAGGSRIAAIPGVHNSPFEILSCIGESSDTAATYKALRHAEQTGGLVVVNIHKATTWEATLQGNSGFKTLCELIKSRVGAGRLQVLTPSEAFDLYYATPISPELNFVSPNLQDLDGDTHLDWWFANSGSLAATYWSGTRTRRGRSSSSSRARLRLAEWICNFWR